MIEVLEKALAPMVVTSSPLISGGMRRSLMLAPGAKPVMTISLLLLVLKVRSLAAVKFAKAAVVAVITVMRMQLLFFTVSPLYYSIEISLLIGK